MKLNYILIYIVFITSFCYSQVPAIEWQKTFGGTNVDGSTKIQQTIDGGYILGGLTFSNDLDVEGNHGGSDFWVIKTSINGTLEWQKTFGGSGNEYLHSLQQTTDGGYILAGYSTSNNGDVSVNNGGSDFWIVKITESGIIEWEKSFGGSSDDIAYSIRQTTDGGYIVAGMTGSSNGDVVGNLGYNDYWVIKLTSLGIIEWQKTLGGSFYDNGYFIQQTSDGGYIVTGNTASIDGDITESYGNDDIFVVKLSTLGSIEWKKSLGGTGSDLSTYVQQTTNDGYIITGQTNSTEISGSSNYGGFDCLIIKLSSLGEIEWQKNYGGSNNDIASLTQNTNDGGLVFVGATYSNDNDVTGNHGDRDYWVIKTNSSGIIQWQKTFGGTSLDSATSIQQTTDGGYIIFGSTSSNDGDFTVNRGFTDYGLIKLGPDSLSNNSFTVNNSLKIYPNPTHDNLTLKLDYYSPSQEIIITDIQGKIIKNQMIEGLTTTINTNSFEKGIYFLTLFSDGNKTTQKFIVE